MPTPHFKIAFEPRQRGAIAFVLPNEAVPKKGKKPDAALEPFRASIRSIEERTGVRLFGKLDTRARLQLIGAVAPMWQTVRGCTASDE